MPGNYGRTYLEGQIWTGDYLLRHLDMQTAGSTQNRGVLTTAVCGGKGYIIKVFYHSCFLFACSVKKPAFRVPNRRPRVLAMARAWEQPGLADLGMRRGVGMLRACVARSGVLLYVHGRYAMSCVFCMCSKSVCPSNVLKASAREDCARLDGCVGACERFQKSF